MVEPEPFMTVAVNVLAPPAHISALLALTDTEGAGLTVIFVEVVEDAVPQPLADCEILIL